MTRQTLAAACAALMTLAAAPAFAGDAVVAWARCPESAAQAAYSSAEIMGRPDKPGDDDQRRR